MSVQSLSLDLLLAGNFYHPGYQMDDMLNVVRWMSEVQGKVYLRLLPVPVQSGPTSGDSWHEKIAEWQAQARRWTIGAAEVFHYFVIHLKTTPVKEALRWDLSYVAKPFVDIFPQLKMLWARAIGEAVKRLNAGLLLLCGGSGGET